MIPYIFDPHVINLFEKVFQGAYYGAADGAVLGTHVASVYFFGQLAVDEFHYLRKYHVFPSFDSNQSAAVYTIGVATISGMFFGIACAFRDIIARDIIIREAD